MLVPVGLSTERYVGGGIGYIEYPGDYGFETRTNHTFVLLSLPSPVPDAPVLERRGRRVAELSRGDAPAR